MSTRGAIAIAEGDGWIGVYNHSDSYPTWLGVRLWGLVQANYEEFVQGIRLGHNPFTDEFGDFQTSENYNGDLEWVYIVSPTTLTVQAMQWRHAPDINSGNPPVFTMSFPLDGPEPNWSIVECGELLERCHHYPICHGIDDPETPDYIREMDHSSFHQVGDANTPRLNGERRRYFG